MNIKIEKAGMKIFVYAVIFLCSTVSMYAQQAKELASELKNPHSEKVLVVAHRGDWRGAPENSLQAFANCIDIRTLSTVFNLVKDLTYRNIDTYAYYPKRFNKDEIPDDYVRNRFKKMSNWRSQVYSDISVEYRISDPTDKEAFEKGDIPRDKLYYDIVIKIPKEVIYLPALVTYDKLDKWCKEGRKVLLPYSTRFYDNSVTYADLSMNRNWVPKYSKYVCIRSFPTWSAYMTAKNSDPNFNPAPMFPMTVLRRFTI